MDAAAEVARAFRRECIALNLARIPWLLLVAMALTLGTIVSLWADPRFGWVSRLLMVDLASAAGFLAAGPFVRRRPPDSRLRALYVWTVVLLALAFMDGYYVLVGRAFGENPVYSLGVVMAATVFVLPPALFLPVLLANHLVFVALISYVAPPAALLPVLLQNSAGAAVAGLVSVLLYRARCAEFSRRRALAAANAALAARNRQLADLMAITAHDLRSPLLGLHDLFALGRRGAALPSEVLGQAARVCGDLLALVNRLLDRHAAEARAERGPLLMIANPRPILAAAIARARLRAAGRAVRIELEAPAGDVAVLLDPEGFVQVMDNLLSNAVKFSPDGATVRVRLWRGARWVCDVSDQGPGVPAADRAALFDRFIRGSRAPATGEPGSGLGLFIAASRMAGMGGEIAYVAGAAGACFRLGFAAEAGEGAVDRSVERPPSAVRSSGP
ncbi:sensor histidine kinase [Aquabacter spiritensis]|uniref:histidine kinase n=1 Tax=Aquabacter spiritensis TaxID=933073 RepID=A0A4R3M7Y0_9HYPH|nr:HAMP domain-containing sensor histidine kinase [Aquabacter spiritensis]TCT07737.1 histidine kinase/DNA gyrase B/HSP90-like ATPase [Aquabacter spiritensis]